MTSHTSNDVCFTLVSSVENSGRIALAGNQFVPSPEHSFPALTGSALIDENAV